MMLLFCSVFLLSATLNVESVHAVKRQFTLSEKCLEATATYSPECLGGVNLATFYTLSNTQGINNVVMNPSLSKTAIDAAINATIEAYNMLCSSQDCIDKLVPVSEVCLKDVYALNNIELSELQLKALLYSTMENIVSFSCAVQRTSNDYCYVSFLRQYEDIHSKVVSVAQCVAAMSDNCSSFCKDAVAVANRDFDCCYNNLYTVQNALSMVEIKVPGQVDMDYGPYLKLFDHCDVTNPGMCNIPFKNPIEKPTSGAALVSGHLVSVMLPVLVIVLVQLFCYIQF